MISRPIQAHYVTRDGRLFSLVHVLACDMTTWAKLPFGVIESSNELFDKVIKRYVVAKRKFWEKSYVKLNSFRGFLNFHQVDTQILVIHL